MCALSSAFVHGILSNVVHRKVYLSQLYPPGVFGGAAPSVPSFIGSKVIMVDILVMVLHLPLVLTKK